MKTIKAKLFNMIMVIAFVLSSVTFVSAATSYAKTNPYGFVWKDNHTGYWNIQYYTYSYSDKSYSISDRVTLKGNTLYDKNGKSIATNVATMSSEDRPTVIFKNSSLYFIFTNGKIGRMTSSTSNSYSTTSTTYAGYFTLTADDIGESIRSNGRNISLTSLSFSGSIKRNSSSSISGSNSSNKPQNRVDIYAYDNDRIAYEAYKSGNSVRLVICKDSNVWSDTYETLISDSCVGAKFVGYTTDYSTVLYDQNGYVYYYLYSDTNYRTPHKVKVKGVINEFKKDSNGFITGVVTNNQTLSWSSLVKK